MNNIRNIFGILIVTIFVLLMTGCSTTNITYEYPGIGRLSKEEAVNFLEGKRVWTGFLSSGLCTIKSVGEKEFRYAKSKLVHTRSDGVYAHYKTVWSYAGTVIFSEITKIKLSTDSTGILRGKIILSGKDGHIIDIYCGNKPEIYNKYISALLVLCPNIDKDLMDREE